MLAGFTQQPQRDSAALLCHVLGKDRTWLLSHPEAELLPDQLALYDALLARRARYEPMQYILGVQEFYGLPLRVTPDVLIPRPETEHLVEAVLARLPHDRPVRIVDVGTGSGAIALALAHGLPLARIDALDISPAALRVAEQNAQALGLADRVRFHHSDLLAAVAGQHFDAVVSNPPYVASTEVLEPQVQQWEPHLALFAGEHGVGIYQRLLPQAAGCLMPAGLLALELGAGQQAALAAMFHVEHGWEEPTFVPDLQGIARVALARRV